MFGSSSSINSKVSSISKFLFVIIYLQNFKHFLAVSINSKNCNQNFSKIPVSPSTSSLTSVKSCIVAPQKPHRSKKKSTSTAHNENNGKLYSDYSITSNNSSNCVWNPTFNQNRSNSLNSVINNASQYKGLNQHNQLSPVNENHSFSFFVKNLSCQHLKNQMDRRPASLVDNFFGKATNTDNDDDMLIHSINMQTETTTSSRWSSRYILLINFYTTKKACLNNCYR